jgi:lysophospholipase L1-like esterase
VRLIAFGDSFVAGVGDPDHLGWIGRALAGRADVTVYNLGVRRETSADVARRWRDEATPRWTDAEPMRLVFSFGANDARVENGAPVLEPAQSLTAAAAILREAQALCPTLLVAAPPCGDDAHTARIAGLNDAFRSLAARLRVPFLNVHAALAMEGTWRAEAAAGDGAHPGARGYRLMAARVTEHSAWSAFLDGRAAH